MTKINKLVIHGFKSFANKTELAFSDGYNVILGPNGAGKSNVGDSICFVLGRISAKSMRAEKVANLLFNGGIKKKDPAKKGIVEISFDNTQKIFPVADGAAEVAIARIISKDGSSTYKVNGRAMTRNQVLDLLSAAKINPDGYNIILQGDIVRFVEMPTLERRRIIEEISDISIYEEKKHKALLELEKVEEKLKEAEVILTERKTHLRELKADRDQALKFRELKDRISSNKATYISMQADAKKKEKEALDKEIAGQREKIAKAEEQVMKLKEELAKKKEGIIRLNKEIEEKGEKEQVRVHREVEKLKVELAESRTRVSTLREQLAGIAQRKDRLHEEVKEVEQKAAGLQKEQEQLEKGIAAGKKQQEAMEEKAAQFRKKNQIDHLTDLEKDIDAKDRLVEQRSDEIQKLRAEQQGLLREKDRLEYQMNSIDGQINKVIAVEQEHKGQIKELKEKKEQFRQATLRLSQCLELGSTFAAQLAETRKSSGVLQEEIARLRAQSITVQERIGGSIAVKKILEKRGKFKGVYGTIAELSRVPQKYQPAVESAAGSKATHLVVEDDKIAADCIRFLKENKFGQANFIPLNKIKPVEILESDKRLLKEKGAHDFLLNLVKFDPKYKEAFAFVFGNTLLVENIDVARSIGIGRIRMATLDGDLAEFSGVMRGGYAEKRRSTLFVEKDVADELREKEEALEKLHVSMKSFETKAAMNEKEIEQLRKAKLELESFIVPLEKSLHLESSDLDANKVKKKEAEDRLKTVEKQLEELQKKASGATKELAQLKAVKQELRDKVSALKDPTLLAQLSAFEENRRKLREEMLQFENEMKTVQMRMDEMLGPGRQRIFEILRQHEKEEKKFSGEVASLQEKIKKQDEELKVKEKESARFYSQYKGMFEQRDRCNLETAKLEDNIEKFREQSRRVEIELNKLSLKNAELIAKLAALDQELEPYKDAPLLKGKSEEELRSEINRFERMLSEMSAVNLKALEIYEHVEGEYAKLLEKRETLLKEKEEVHTLMNEIEGKKKEQFMKTLHVINEGFQRIFSTLFKKGNAYLELENEKNPFDGGLDIKVKLTGQRYMDIKSLSGGEKTLTALSLIFSIQEHNPASFYILDEIDAALDKHNSEKLSKLIRAYVGHGQYIMISHNDSIISEADNLYGVSMDEFGVSKVTTLKV